jgi:hypothetical protein
MKSKVLLFALAATTLSLTAKAQVSFGLRAGLNLANVTGKDITGDKIDGNKLKAGFNIGVNAEMAVAPGFYLQPGVLFTTKGTTVDNGSSSDSKINLSYIEVPVNFIYKPALGPGKLLLGAGPYAAFGVGGKVKVGSNDSDIKFKNEVTSTEYGANYYVKRLDVGGNLLVGYELAKKISFQLNAQLGMSKINPKISDYSADKQSLKNTGFGVSVGYRF